MPPAPPTILVVDDDAGLLILIEDALRAEKYNVATAMSGADALAWLKSHSADLLLLDLKLSDIGGKEFIAALADAGHSVPFIIITGQGDERVAVDMMKRGALDYLVKDAEFVELLPVVVRRALVLIEKDRRLAEAEKALGQSESLKQAVIHSLPAHIALLDSAGRIVAVNQAWNRFARENGDTGLTRTGVGANYLQVCRVAEPQGANEALRGIERVLAGIQPDFSLEYDCHSPSSERWFLMRVTPLAEPGQGAVISHTDITERRRAEETLRKSEERLGAFLDNSAVIAWMKDEAGRHVFLSRNYQKRFGVKMEDWRGKTDFELWPTEIAKRFRQHDLTALEKNHSVEVVEQALNPDGSVSWWLNSKFVFVDESGARYVGGLGVDITERKLLAEQLLHLSEREQRKFGHELHDGLGQRLTGLEMMSHGLAEDLKEHAADLSKQARRLNRELRETVTQARLISHSLAPVPLEGDGLMRGLNELAASTSRLPGVKCQFTCDPPVSIDDVPTATNLYRIAQEAVNNALKHGKARKVEITLTGRAGEVELAIANNGRALRRKTGRTNGGLGLSVMRYRAEMIGATLDIESGKRQGVRVVCTFRRKT